MTIGLSIAQRTAAIDPQSEQAARLVMATADQIYDVLHLMIPRLRPLALDHFGLADAVEDMVSDWRAQQPLMQFDVHMANLPEELPEPIATAAYRIVQEAVNNAIRHADATRVGIEIGLEASRRMSTTRRRQSHPFESPSPTTVTACPRTGPALVTSACLGCASGPSCLAADSIWVGPPPAVST